MTVRFEAAWAAVFLILLPALWYTSARSRTNLSAKHRYVAAWLRSLAVTAVVIALAQPVWVATTREVSVVYALDVSRSIALDFVGTALNWMQSASGRAATARYVAFAGRPKLLGNLDALRDVGVTDERDADDLIYQGATNIELALQESLLGFDARQLKRLVLLSDGNQTGGDVWSAVPRLKEAGVRVFTIPAKPRARKDVWVESLQAPDTLRRDEPGSVSVRVVAQQPTGALVSIEAGNVILASRAVALRVGINSVNMPVRLGRSGSVSLTASVKAQDDEIAANNRAQQSVWVGPRAKILYVEGQPNASQYLRDALVNQGIEVDTRAAEDLPADVASLDRYDAVMLSDIPIAHLSEEKMSAVNTYVRERGGGLLFAAGESTYGEKGFAGTPLERALPVDFKAQEKRKDLALAVVVDRSYSMKGRNIELAKAATIAALEMLEEQHRFTVITFDSQPYETVPLQYVRSRKKAEDLISRIQASGQTNIYPALQITYRVLAKSGAKSKHVILLSDGDTAPADFERLLNRMNKEQITVSTVALGLGADKELMGNIAKWGKGRAYHAQTAQMVPQIFVEDTQNAVRANLVEEPVRVLVKRRIEALRGIDFKDAPALKGFASTQAKPLSEVLLTSESGAPILARWHHGLGKTVAFTSDVKNRWAADWINWNGYGKFWGQLVRETMRRELNEELRFAVRREGDEAIVEVHAANPDGTFRDQLAPRIRVHTPEGASSVAAMRQIAPGFYQLKMPVATSTAAPFRFELMVGGGISAQWAGATGARSLYYPFSDELRSLPPNTELLRAIARETGGKYAPTMDEIFADYGEVGQIEKPLWRWFALVALVFYLLDLSVRRAPIVRRWLDT
ncbi:MAG: VWA domain-containing protein [Betaproteobacteria bacterium]|nr:VWA domain-containing protein [Betaproteobacteria bacterium]